MPTKVILPALGMAQETGKIVRWLKAEGEQVTQGEPLVEIETDKATVEIEAPASGLLANVTPAAGDDIPVGQPIAAILAPGELPQKSAVQALPASGKGSPERGQSTNLPASPLASRMAAEHNVDLSSIKPTGRRIQKADVLTYIQEQKEAASVSKVRLAPASPKARRLAAEQGKNLASITGTGPDGAVLAADVLSVPRTGSSAPVPVAREVDGEAISRNVSESQQGMAISNIWRIMAERTTQSWTTVPHFYLVREVNASRLVSWREHLQKRRGADESVRADTSGGRVTDGRKRQETSGEPVKITYTDLLVKVVAAALQEHPRLNATWKGDTNPAREVSHASSATHSGEPRAAISSLTLNDQVNVGLAVAVEDGLVVPVIQRANERSVYEIAKRRQELVNRAMAGKLRPEDILGGTFTISNLGMYGVDAFNAVINPPQVAILAIGRIAQRIVPVDGKPLVQPMMVLTLSCDHRAVDGARAAQFLTTVSDLIEEPLGLLELPVAHPS